MEIKVATTGVSCHGSAPERGDNAIFKMAPILNELQVLHTRLKEDDFLGKGSLTVSEIFSSSPSRCAVADGCWISIDRRLTVGENGEHALQEIRDLPAVKDVKAQVSMYTYGQPSYTGLVYPTDSYFPAWILEENHPACLTLVAGYKRIPCIGFGPGHEDQAHAPNEKTWKSELVQSAAMYAVIPAIYVQQFAR
jgi:putative selenium metabolism hydrolase